MALKDLVAQKAKLTEEAIEEIISEYARYDAEEREVVFTPEAATLSNKAKVLVFLVAQQGWQFVLDESIDVEIAPLDIGESLGIQGGTLRPLLKDLKDRNLVSVRDRKYSVRPSSLDAIKAELSERKQSTLRPKGRTAKRKHQRARTNTESSPNVSNSLDNNAEKSPKHLKHAALSPGKAFDDMVGSGFFDNGKTLAELQERLHERAIIIKQTSLPSYLLAAVRKGRLARKKNNVSGKMVWVYTTAK